MYNQKKSNKEIKILFKKLIKNSKTNSQNTKKEFWKYKRNGENLNIIKQQNNLKKIFKWMNMLCLKKDLNFIRFYHINFRH